MFPVVVKQPGRRRLPRRRAHHRREAVRPRSASARDAERDAARGVCRSSRSSASITTSARKRCRTSCSSASPTRCSSRSGIVTTSRTCRSRWRKRSASTGRGKFYEETGVIRDVIQNHLFQVLSFLAMEPPSSIGAEAIRDEQAKVLRTVRPIDPDDLVLGQFRGYRDRKPASRRTRSVPTYAALRLHVDSWRWEGVPFFVRAGKSLARTVHGSARRVEAGAARGLPETAPAPRQLRALPPRPASGDCHRRDRSRQPGERLDRQARRALGRCARTPATTWTPYERLLGDAMHGDATLFARQDVVEAAWAIVDPLINRHVVAALRVHAGELGTAGGETSRRRRRRMEHAGGVRTGAYTNARCGSTDEHPPPVSDQGAARLSGRDRGLQHCDAECSAGAAPPTSAPQARRRHSAPDPVPGRAVTRGDVRRSREADAGHDDAGRAAAGRRLVAVIAGAVPRAAHRAAESRARGHRRAGDAVESACCRASPRRRRAIDSCDQRRPARRCRRRTMRSRLRR